MDLLAPVRVPPFDPSGRILLMCQPTDQPTAGTQMKITVSTPGLGFPMMVGLVMIVIVGTLLGVSDLDVVTKLILTFVGAAFAMVLSYASACETLTAFVTNTLSSELKYATVKVDENFTRFEASNTATDPVYGALQRLDTGDIFAKQRTFLVTFIG